MDGAGGVGSLLWVTLHAASGSASGIQFVCYDGNGNIVSLVSGTTGDVTARYEYGPFGEPIRVTGPAATLNPFRFSTKRTDPTTDLLLYEYRAYSPTLGRWTSRDQAEEEPTANAYLPLGHALLGEPAYTSLAAQDTEPSLSAKIRKAKPGSCGEFEWKVTWKLVGGKTKAGGGVIQHMVWKFDIKDTKGVPLSNEKLTEKLGWNPQTSGNYWELWKVNEKGKFDPSNIDVWKGAPWPGTKGTITIVGSASFYPFGKLFPSGFADYQPSPAGTLLWTMTDPGLRNGRGRV